MRRTMPALTVAAFSLLAGFAEAEQRPVVVELYTSQGCSSCPPADELLAALGDRDDVIPIALHVDYWDYIGWKDQFGNPAHADRQRTYASKAGRRSIYTPEMVINGSTDLVGAKPMKLAETISMYAAEAPRMTLDIARKDGGVQINGTPPTGDLRAMDVHVLNIMPSHETEITKGENRGKTITYSNIARDWRVAGTWDGAAPLQMTASDAGEGPVVVIVQEADGGAIIAAARID